MIYKFNNKMITSILNIIPSNEVKYEDEIHNYNFYNKSSVKLKELMGYEKHRYYSENVTLSEVAFYGINILIENRIINLSDIGAILFVSESRDYLMPPTSNIIHGKISKKYNKQYDIYGKLDESVICIDIPQACTGFTLGLYQSYLLLDILKNKKVLLINGKTKHYSFFKDRSTWPLLGEACSLSIIENSGNNKIFFSNYVDGINYDSLYIPAGGTVNPSSNDSLKYYYDEEGNQKNLHHIHMNGFDIYKFTQEIVPKEIKKIMLESNTNDGDIYCYLLHQPNKFILEKLREKLDFIKNNDKFKTNIVGIFGNSASSTIPILIANNYKSFFQKNIRKVLMCGFGAGLSCNCIITDFGNLKFLKTIEYLPNQET